MARQQVVNARGCAARSHGSEPCLKRPLNARGSLITLAALTVAAGCSDPPKHPALIDPCAGASCPVLGGIGQGSASGGAGGVGSGNGNGNMSGNGGAANNGVVRGTVVDLVDDTFKTTITDTQPAIVEAQGATQAIVSADWDGIDPFELKGIQTALNVSWLSVRPKNGNASIRTITPVSASLVGNIALPLIQTDVIDAIFLGLSTPATRTAGSGQLVVSFVNSKTSLGASGVKVTSSSTAIVAYRMGGIWSTDVAQTDNSGLVLVGNLPVSAFPGTNISLTLSGLTTGSTNFQVAADAVTLAELRLTL